MPHWLELRKRFLRTLCLFLIIFIFIYIKFDTFIHIIFNPLLKTFIYPNTLILTHLSTSLFLPIEWSYQFAMLLTLPYLILELWWFILPGLYKQEKRLGLQYLITSFILFCTGIMFCYFIILPCMFNFLIHQTPNEMHLMLEASEAFDWIIYSMIIFGSCFQLPLICISSVELKILSTKQLQQARRFVIVSCFFIGMILAPPDVGSQTLIAIPLWGLYELGLLSSILLQKSRKKLAFSIKS